jgi:hypothetical protein
MEAGRELASGEAREQIFVQHGVLRVRLAEMAEAADQAEGAGGGLEVLRARASSLYEALAAHMAFEEQVLAAALRDVVGWGAVIQQKLEDDHDRQRAMLVEAIRATGPAGLTGLELVENVRVFARTLLHDMATEERGLLEAEFDALSRDGQGG